MLRRTILVDLWYPMYLHVHLLLFRLSRHHGAGKAYVNNLGTSTSSPPGRLYYAAAFQG